MLEVCIGWWFNCIGIQYNYIQFAMLELCLISLSVAITLTNVLYSRRLAYSLSYGVTAYDLSQLQGIQNTLCCITTRPFSITHHLKSLYWLPLKY